MIKFSSDRVFVLYVGARISSCPYLSTSEPQPTHSSELPEAVFMDRGKNTSTVTRILIVQKLRRYSFGVSPATIAPIRPHVIKSTKGNRVT